MQDFFTAHVFPEFTSPVAHLRVRALEMVEKFEEADMTWPDSDVFKQLFTRVMVCMTDSELAVRVQAALALPEIIRYEDSEQQIRLVDQADDDIQLAIYWLPMSVDSCKNCSSFQSKPTSMRSASQLAR